MEATRQHLLRVSDIIGEIESRLRSLRLQAQKAERYKRYKGELRDLELWSASQRFLGLLAEEKSLAARDRRDRPEPRATAERSLEAEEAAVEAERLAVTEEMTELAAAKDELFALSNKAQLGAQRAEHHQDEADACSARAAAGPREIEELTARLTEHAAAIADLEGQLARLGRRGREQRRPTYEARTTAHEELRAGLARPGGGWTRRGRGGAGAGADRPQWNPSRRPRWPDATTWRAAGGLRCEAGGRRRARWPLVRRATERADGAAWPSIARAPRRAGRPASRTQEARLAALKRGRCRAARWSSRPCARRRTAAVRAWQSLSEIQDRYESFQQGVRAIMQKRRERRGAG